MAEPVARWGEPPPSDDDAAARGRLLAGAEIAVWRPSVNLAVVTVRAVDDELEPPRTLWLDAVLAASDAGAVALVLERADDGSDRLETVDLRRLDPAARARIGDDDWVRATVRTLALGR